MQGINFQPIQFPKFVSDSSTKIPESQSRISSLSKQIIEGDIEILQNELSKILKIQNGLSSIFLKIEISRKQTHNVIDSLNIQSKQLKQKIENYKKALEKSNNKQVQKQIQSNKKKYLSSWENRISIANQLNIQLFKNIDLDDRKSLANELFKWIIVAIYGETQIKYYWPNFKDQIFQKDDGKDFKERLGKVNAANAKQEQVLKAQDFISKYSQIVQSQELIQLKQVHPEAEKLRQVAQIFIQCNQLARKTADLQRLIQVQKQGSLKLDEEAMRWKAKHEALEKRKQVAEEYLKTLDEVKKQFEKKKQSYSKKQKIARGIMLKVSRGEDIAESDMQEFIQI